MIMNNFLNQVDPKRRRQMLMVGVGILLIISVLIVMYLLMHGWITVKINKPDGIIKIFNQKNELVIHAENKESLSVWVPTGEYTISAQSRTNDNYTKRDIEVTSLSNNKTELTIPNNPEPEAITNLSMQLPQFSSSKLHFFDVQARRIAAVGEDNTINYISLSFSSVRNMHWNQDGTAFIMGKKANEPTKLFFYDGAEFTEIMSEGIVGSMSFVVNEAGVLYVCHGTSLYSSNNNGKTMNRIADVPRGIIRAAHGDKLILAQSSNKTVNNQPQFSYDIISIDTGGREYGKLHKTSGESPDVAYGVSWSPDGTKVLVVDGFSGIIYDRSFKEINRLPGGLVRSPVWENNNSILYAGESSIWRYDMKEKTTTSIASVPQILKVYSLQRTPDQTVYFQAGTTQYTSWYRVHLYDSQKPNELANILGGSDTRLLTPFCGMNYLNLNRLSIIERIDVSKQVNFPDAPIKLKTELTAAACRDSVTEYFNNMRLSLDQVNIQSFIFPL